MKALVSVGCRASHKNMAQALQKGKQKSKNKKYFRIKSPLWRKSRVRTKDLIR
jgi:hypothetical protein